VLIVFRSLPVAPAADAAPAPRIASSRVTSWNFFAPSPVKPRRTTFPWPDVPISAEMAESFRSPPVASGIGLVGLSGWNLKR
jgi:hypothetical protein